MQQETQRLHTINVWCLILLLAASTAACRKPPRGGPRVATYPVRGQVIVDGEPAAQVQVTCHKFDGESPVLQTIAAMSDADGKFTIGTYEGNDGAPEGEYRLTFMWGEINLLSAQYGGPDKLNGRYADKEKSDVHFTVKPGDEPLDLGRIELTTK
jgi:hypothetical protein